MEIYIRNLPYEAETSEIAAPFMNYGRVIHAKQIVGDAGPGDIRNEGKPKGYGFVTMPNMMEAEKAIECLHKKLVFLSNLSPEATTEEMEALFEEYLPMVSRIANLGNPEIPEEETSRGTKKAPRVLSVSANYLGYIIFRDERVAESFIAEYGRPHGKAPVIHGHEVPIRMAKMEKAKSRSQ